MKIAQVVLDYVRVLLWPCLLALVVLRFGPSITRVIERFQLKEATLKVPGVDVSLKAFEVTQELENRIDGPVQALTTPGRLREASGRGGLEDLEDSRVAAPAADGPDAAADEAARRRAVEQLLASAATWGWKVAQLGMEQPPQVTVIWDPYGRPRLSPGPLPPHG